MDFFIWKPAESKKVVSELHAFHVTLGSVKGHFHTQKKFIALVERPKTKFLRKELKLQGALPLCCAAGGGGEGEESQDEPRDSGVTE